MNMNKKILAIVTVLLKITISAVIVEAEEIQRNSQISKNNEIEQFTTNLEGI